MTQLDLFRDVTAKRFVTGMAVDDETLMAAYERHGSIYKVADELDMTPQAVHYWLKKFGADTALNVFTDADRARLLAEYEHHANAGTIQELAVSMGRTRQFLCRQAKALGLTRYGRQRPYQSEAASISARERIAKNGHPRGMLGKKHTEATKAVVSERSRQSWARMTEEQKSEMTLKMMKTKVERGNNVMPRIASWKAAWHEIGSKRCYYRSRWEANYARYLEWLRLRGEIADWEHEPETFWFEKIMRGCRSYLPDFRVTENNGQIVYHEVKGWMDDRSKTKIKRMGIYHPNVKLIVIDAKEYRKLQAQVSMLVPGWERG
jgi:hypothetical protein